MESLTRVFGMYEKGRYRYDPVPFAVPFMNRRTTKREKDADVMARRKYFADQLFAEAVEASEERESRYGLGSR